jgi:hypothetical protein
MVAAAATAPEPLWLHVPELVRLSLVRSTPNSVPAVPCVALVSLEPPLDEYHE